MEFRGIIFISFLFLLLGVDSNAFPMNDLITKLPGQPDVNFRQFAGYIDVDENVVGRSLFYYFVEAEKDPMTQPLTIWLTGGPGCSSVGDGFGSVGPFIVTKDAHALQTNFFSWNKVSNLLFIDSPIGSGWSYSNISIDYNNGDDSTNNILLTFMQKWYEKYPVFKSKDLYLAGLSFAGHFVPNLANALLDDNKQSKQSKFNLKGLVVPKVSTEVDMCIPLRVQFYFNLPEVQKAFHGNRTNLSYQWKGCFTASFKYNEADKDLDMLPALQNLLQQSIPITIFRLVYICMPIFLQYFPEITGDQDGIIPTMGTLQHLEKLADELNIKLTKRKHGALVTRYIYASNYPSNMITQFGSKLQQEILSVDSIGLISVFKASSHYLPSSIGLEGGLKYEFGDLLKFLTVKGSNHHVTSSRPSQAFSIYKIFAINWMH
ncbi:hypothetical protein CXB51_016627 [Gossypium anomalum]|uniref:Serine carboxypeptidase-like 44 n=1 Tax=Gossypium anomalum TaxID=47600 RepID=A0A8J5Z4Q2_9ROSI|nr:hypothetical protein CXB51_016627 [Gossypium anomalum]